MQNNLEELWSLMAFIMPDVFTNSSINLKGYFDVKDKNLKIINNIKATLLSFVIHRTKSDVMSDAFKDKFMRLEMVAMNDKHSLVYKAILEECKSKSLEMSNLFIKLRNIANHPLLVTMEKITMEHLSLSTKIQKLNNILLDLKNGHRCLLLSQGSNMLDILEWFLKELKYSYYCYSRSTHISIAQFNDDPTIFVFLFTTKAARRGITFLCRYNNIL